MSDDKFALLKQRAEALVKKIDAKDAAHSFTMNPTAEQIATEAIAELMLRCLVKGTDPSSDPDTLAEVFAMVAKRGYAIGLLDQLTNNILK